MDTEAKCVVNPKTEVESQFWWLGGRQGRSLWAQVICGVRLRVEKLGYPEYDSERLAVLFLQIRTCNATNGSLVDDFPETPLLEDMVASACPEHPPTQGHSAPFQKQMIANTKAEEEKRKPQEKFDKVPLPFPSYPLLHSIKGAWQVNACQDPFDKPDGWKYGIDDVNTIPKNLGWLRCIGLIIATVPSSFPSPHPVPSHPPIRPIPLTGPAVGM